ncbi:uncharacterized protein LOC117316306 [Pecten maximus]|uniref:uncharacterized protein LOC117316306 n=1 Tax=Pecten maximus TaxID=6579 RepID=UPI001458E81F|nr:uncharacterized protein LOC117316306 [Pecten maximus]
MNSSKQESRTAENFISHLYTFRGKFCASSIRYHGFSAAGITEESVTSGKDEVTLFQSGNVSTTDKEKDELEINTSQESGESQLINVGTLIPVCLVGLGFLSLVLLKICLQGRSTQRPESPSPDNTSGNM